VDRDLRWAPLQSFCRWMDEWNRLSRNGEQAPLSAGASAIADAGRVAVRADWAPALHDADNDARHESFRLPLRHPHGRRIAGSCNRQPWLRSEQRHKRAVPSDPDVAPPAQALRPRCTAHPQPARHCGPSNATASSKAAASILRLRRGEPLARRRRGPGDATSATRRPSFVGTSSTRDCAWSTFRGAAH